MNSAVMDMRSQIRDELADILHFWSAHAVDGERGGFYGYISKSNEVDRLHDKAAVLNTRILWTFSAAYAAGGVEKHLTLAERALDYIAAHFIDREHGGVYWMLDALGKPVSDKKQTYAQAFAVYSLAELYLASRRQDSLDLAISVYRAIEAHCHDDGGQGYLEARARDWSLLPDMSLSAKDMNAEKTMNTHLHLLEAYTNLYRAWQDEGLKARLKELLDVMLNRVLGAEHSYGLFFDRGWRLLSDIVSYGHDIEGSWLMCEAAEVLGDRRYIEQAEHTAVAMARQVAEHGVDRRYGGVFNESKAGHLDADKVWWVQAEAVVGFLNACEITGDHRWFEEARSAWEFIRRHIRDTIHGEWAWQTARDGSASPPDEKAGPWKCPYHNARMCIEAMRRLEKLNTTDERES